MSHAAPVNRTPVHARIGGPRAMLVLLIGSMASGLIVPIYTDEVGWRFQLSRYFQDGGLDRAIGESCGPNTSAAPAWFMLPVRAFSSATTALLSDPLAVRLSGIALAVAGVLLMRGLIRRAVADRSRRAVLEMIAYALLGVGVLPYLLVLSRPEQPLWLALVGSLWLSLCPASTRDERPLAISGIVLLAVIAMSYHLKALFCMPVFVLAVVLAGWGGGRRSARLIALAALGGFGWAAFRYWSDRFACSGDPVIAAQVARGTITTALLAGGPAEAVRLLPVAIGNMAPTLYIRNILPAIHHMSDWLPAGGTLADAVRKPWFAICRTAWQLALLLGIAGLVASLLDRSRNWAALAIALVLAGVGTAWAALQIEKNAYESSFYLPLMALAIVFAWCSPSRVPRWLGWSGWLLAGVSAASQLLLAAHYLPLLWPQVRAGGYVAGQPYSLSAFHYPRTEILRAGAKCAIVPGPKLRRVLIDDLTYFAYAQSHNPMHRLGVLSTWNGSIGDPVAWMRRQGSPGAVIGCRYLPPDLRRQAIATGAFCCLRTP